MRAAFRRYARLSRGLDPEQVRQVVVAALAERRGQTGLNVPLVAVMSGLSEGWPRTVEEMCARVTYAIREAECGAVAS